MFCSKIQEKDFEKLIKILLWRQGVHISGINIGFYYKLGEYKVGLKFYTGQT